MWKKLLSRIMVLAMLLALLPAQPVAVAAEATALDSVTAYLTVSLQDEGSLSFAQARDGSSMAAKAVEVSDLDNDGLLTLYDMLCCAHEQFAPGGMNDFATVSGTKNAVTAKKIWGHEDSFAFFLTRGLSTIAKSLTNIRSSSINTSIVEGSHLYVVQGTLTDFFSNTTARGPAAAQALVNVSRLTVLANQSFTIGLYTFDSSKTNPMQIVAAAKNREIAYVKSGSGEVTTAGTTNAQGKLELTLTEPGEYLLYSKPTDGKTAPAACIVQVLEERLDIDGLHLSLSETGENLITDFDAETMEYTITIPDGTDMLYARVLVGGAGNNIRLYLKGTNSFSDINSETLDTLSLPDAQQLTLYLNDIRLDEAKNEHIGQEYTVNILRQVQLTGLETSGALLSDADHTTGALDVYVAHDATEATLTPTAAEGDVITVNGQAAVSGEAVTVTLDASGTTTAEVKVHREGEGYVDRSYTVTFHAAGSDATPVFREQPSTEKQEYFVGDNEVEAAMGGTFSYVEKLTVYADAGGEVTYQWYSNTANSTEGGAAIEGATERSYEPSAESSGETWYYCVASCGDKKTASTLSHVVVHEKPTLDWADDLEIPALPTDKAELFGEKTHGFYYQKGDTDVTPLRVTLDLPDSLADRDDVVVSSFYWNVPAAVGDSFTEEPYFTPATWASFGGCEYKVIARLDVPWREYDVNISCDTGIYVYVDQAENTLSPEVASSAWPNGDGTELSPWELTSQEDLVELAAFVKQGYSFSGAYFLMTQDISLDGTWVSIGTGDSSKGDGWSPFSGTLDGGGHTLSYAEGTDQPLFGYVREASVKNLAIYAPYMKNYGLVSNYAVDYGDDGLYGVGVGGSYAAGCPDTIDITNVTIKSGSVIEQSGFIGGFASGGNTVNILNCTVEDNVKIGWNLTENCSAEKHNIGSFGGLFNGTISNCVSYADVYGSNFVGGIAGDKGQSMGYFEIDNCAFLGTVNASGNCVGGIAGSGYNAGSAPNTPGSTIRNCYVSGDITGGNYVGGILGMEFQIQAWNTSYIQNNCFYGTVRATEENGTVGGIIGRLNSLNSNNFIENNYSVEGCGAEKAIGYIEYLDTSATVPAPGSTTVFNTADKLPQIRGVSKRNLNRSDDPLGADADKLGAVKTLEQFKDGTVAQLLNASESSLKNWITSENGPVHSREPIVYKLSISGNYQTSYVIGENLNLSGAVFTASRSDNLTFDVPLDEIEISGYDKNTRGVQTLTAKYGLVTCEFTVTVLKAENSDPTKNVITVYFKLMGDDNHNWADDYIPEEEEAHTLQYGGLKTWISNAAYTIDRNATVADLLNLVAEKHGVVFDNPTGNYVESVTYNGITLGEFDNGNLSGWMYTLNESHPIYGISEQFLEDGDRIVLHYTDDYTKEEGSEHWGTGGTTGGVTSRTEGSSPVLEPEVSVDKNGHATVVVPRKDLSKAIESASENGTQSIVIAPQVSGNATSLTVTIPKSSVTDILDETKAGLSIECDLGEIELPQDALAAIVKAAGSSDITVTIAAGDSEDAAKLLGSHEDVTEERMKDASATVITITSDQKYITAFDGRQIALTLPVGGEAIEEGKSYVVYQISDDGTVERLAGECIKQGKKFFVKVTTTHLNTFVVLPVKTVELPFTDVQETDWFYNAVSCAYVNGLFNGTSNTTFSPNDTMTRAMLATVLYRTAGSPAIDGEGVAFTDVPLDTWYTDAVAWANGNGIVTGYGNGLFGGGDSITREQLVVMLYRYAKLMKHDTAAAGDLSAFTDAGNASDWAVEALRWAYAEGLITGRTATTIVPQGTATRAEVAMILMRFGEELAK